MIKRIMNKRNFPAKFLGLSYSFGAILGLWGLFFVLLLGACKKPVSEYTVKIETTGQDAHLHHVHVVYFNQKSEKVTDHNPIEQASFEKQYTALQGKSLSVVAEAALASEADHEHHHNAGNSGTGQASAGPNESSAGETATKEISLKISILKDGKEVKSQTKSSKTGSVSEKVEITA